jgi:hypothetical protein
LAATVPGTISLPEINGDTKTGKKKMNSSVSERQLAWFSPAGKTEKAVHLPGAILPIAAGKVSFQRANGLGARCPCS